LGEQLTPIRVLVVQDHPILATAIVEILEGEPGLSVYAVARTGADAILLASQERFRVALMDYRLPDMNGAEAANLIRTANPDTAIVFHTADDSEEAVLEAIGAGASAYLPSSATAEDILEAVRRAAQEEVLIPVALFAKAVARQRRLAAEEKKHETLLAEFTSRELDVLRLLGEGFDTAAMARRLNIAPHTVEWHVRHVIEKLGVHSKLQAMLTATRLGIIDVGLPAVKSDDIAEI
jgi:two-component system, NarL family, nitrate/nitrite response regulator NarL